MNYQGRHKHTIWIYDDLWEQVTARYPIDGQKRPPHAAINMLLATGLSVMLGITCTIDEDTGAYHATSDNDNSPENIH